MAEKKSPPASARKPAGKAGGRAKTGKSGPAAGARKASPVVLDPPERPPKQAAKKSETIDAKPVKTAEAPSADKAAETPGDKAAGPSENRPAGKPPPPPEAAPRAGTPRPLSLFAALVLGGLLAGGAGYLAARLTTPPPPPPADDSAALQALSKQIASDIAALEARLAALESRPPDSAVEGLRNDLAALGESLDRQAAALSERLGLTEERLQKVVRGIEETRQRLADALPEGGAQLDAALAEILDSYGAEIEALREQIAAQSAAREALAARIDALSETAARQLQTAREKIDALSSAAAEAAQGVDLARSAEKLRAALATGRAYADLLAEIARQGGIDIPEALQQGAATGIPPLMQLQTDFPAAARAGLKASIRASAGDGLTARLGAFLKSQVAARSLEEREGDDPDAILSRAEAALKRGALDRAVDLVRSLPPAGVAAMSEWLAAAESRLEAEAAMETLGNRLRQNN